MNIGVASTGDQITVEISPAALVAQLQEHLEGKSSIPVADQILLCGNVKLKSDRTLQSYQIASNSQEEIFLFDRKAFDINAAKPLPEVLLNVLTETPPTLEPPSLGPGISTELYKLRLNENRIRLNCMRAEKIYISIENRAILCDQTYHQIYVQTKAIDTSVRYTNSIYETLRTDLATFIQQRADSTSKTEAMISSFESDIQKLRDISLHPALTSSNQQRGKTLLEVVNETDIRTFYEKCKREHYKLKDNMTKLEKDVFGLSYFERAQFVNADVLIEKLDTVEEAAAQSKSLLDPMAKDLKVFEEEVARVAVTVNKSKMGIDDQNIVAKMNQLQELSDKALSNHNKMMSLLEEYHKNSVTILAQFSTLKNKVNKDVFTTMTKITNYSTLINGHISFFHRLKQAIEQTTKDTSKLKFVGTFPIVYNSCLEEISRRRMIARRFNNEVVKINEKINKFVANENARRESFIKDNLSQSPQLLFDLIPGLFETIKVQLPDFSGISFDARLPKIDFPDTPEPLGADDFIISASPTIKSPPPPPPRSQASVVLDAQIVALQEELAKAKRESENYTKRIQHLEIKLSQAYNESMNESLEEMMKSSTTFRELEQKQEENQNMGRQIEQLQKEIATLNGKLKEKEKKINEQAATLESLADVTSSNAELTKSLKEKEEDLDKVKKDLETAKSQMRELTNDISKAKEELEKATKHKEELDKVNQLLDHIREGLREFSVLEDNTNEPPDVLLSNFQTLVKDYSALKRKSGREMISLSKFFEAGDLAMFFPNNTGYYEAFNKDCPCYLLADESAESFQEHIKRKICVVGQVIAVTKREKGDPEAVAAKLRALGSDYYYDVILMQYD